MKNKIIFFLCLFLVLNFTLYAQTGDSRIESIKLQLENLSEDVPQLNNKVSFSVSGVSLYEFLRGLAMNNKLNMNIASTIDTPVAINFTNVQVKTLLVYLSDEYDLDLLINGNIISVLKLETPPIEIQLPQPKEISISYNRKDHLISYDLQNDTLGKVLKKITELTGLNISTTQKLLNNSVSGYIKDVPIEKAINELAFTNNYSITMKDSNTFHIEEPLPKTTTVTTDIPNKPSMPLGLKLTTNNKDSIFSLQANNVPIKEVLSAVAAQFNINYFVFSDIKGNIETKMNNVDFPTFLKYLFNGTDYTYRLNNGIYLVGDRKLETIRSADVYPLKYRTITKLLDLIPNELKKGLEVIPVPDLNSLVIAGSSPAVIELESFLRQIDKSVPVISIELIILDVTKTHNISTGISAGIDNTKTTSYTSVFPNVDVTLGSNTINSIINSINGTGIVNLGKVKTNFYVSLKASEDNGSIKIRSTPHLATLNGTEAQMTIGETRYYSEQTSNVIATQNTTTISSVVYKPLQANLTVIVKPIVSGDEQITLDISVEQSSFTNQISTNGPYGQTTRSFKSSLRVNNNEMLLLGGLEEKNSNDSGTGFPILSRIPIIKWIFSSRTSSLAKSKLAILIHPTVFY